MKTTKWANTEAFASGDTVAVFGVMDANTLHSGQEIGTFSFALRAKVRDGQIVLWHWFEDSFAVSQAYHGRKWHRDTPKSFDVMQCASQPSVA